MQSDLRDEPCYGALAPQRAYACATDPSALPAHVADQVAQTGELLIRAAASLGFLSASEQDLVSKSDGGALAKGIATALNACKAISPVIAESLHNHPPQGFIAP